MNQLNSCEEERHPLFTHKYAVYTPPADEMIERIGDWIDDQITGAYLYGPSRLGKTVTIERHLRMLLSDRFSYAIPMVVWAKWSTTLTETEFWNDILKATDFAFKNNGKQRSRSDASGLFIDQLDTLARSARQDFVVLVIDEAQTMTLNDWKCVLAAQNALERRSVRLCVISVASHGIKFQPNHLARTGNSHITARFLSEGDRVRGIRSADEIGYVLRGYDEDSEWPEGSGISFTKYFASDDFERGERLANHQKEVWDAFTHEFPTQLARNTKYPVEIPMLHLSRLVERILRRAHKRIPWGELLNPEALQRSVRGTGYAAHMDLIASPE
jgi:hypothetical protein